MPKTKGSKIPPIGGGYPGDPRPTKPKSNRF